MVLDKAENGELRRRLQAVRAGDEDAIHELWEECLARGFDSMLLAKLQAKYPQFKRLMYDLAGEAVIRLRAALVAFDESRCRIVSWNNLMQFVHLYAGRDLARYATQHGGDGGAVDVPRRETEAGAGHLDVAYVDSLPHADGEDGDSWDWAEIQPDTDNEAVLAEWLDRKHELEI